MFCILLNKISKYTSTKHKQEQHIKGSIIYGILRIPSHSYKMLFFMRGLLTLCMKINAFLEYWTATTAAVE